MKETVVCDERGRVVLPREARARYGEEFYVVLTKSEVVLIPVSKRPVEELGELGKSAGIERYGLKRLKRELRKQALKEV